MFPFGMHTFIYCTLVVRPCWVAAVLYLSSPAAELLQEPGPLWYLPTLDLSHAGFNGDCVSPRQCQLSRCETFTTPPPLTVSQQWVSQPHPKKGRNGKREGKQLNMSQIFCNQLIKGIWRVIEVPRISFLPAWPIDHLGRDCSVCWVVSIYFFCQQA